MRASLRASRRTARSTIPTRPPTRPRARASRRGRSRSGIERVLLWILAEPVVLVGRDVPRRLRVPEDRALRAHAGVLVEQPRRNEVVLARLDLVRHARAA